jgi:hypothetical protein
VRGHGAGSRDGRAAAAADVCVEGGVAQCMSTTDRSSHMLYHRQCNTARTPMRVNEWVHLQSAHECVQVEPAALGNALGEGG